MQSATMLVEFWRDPCPIGGPRWRGNMAMPPTAAHCIYVKLMWAAVGGIMVYALPRLARIPSHGRTTGPLVQPPSPRRHALAASYGPLGSRSQTIRNSRRHPQARQHGAITSAGTGRL